MAILALLSTMSDPTALGAVSLAHWTLRMVEVALTKEGLATRPGEPHEMYLGGATLAYLGVILTGGALLGASGILVGKLLLILGTIVLPNPMWAVL